MDTVALAARAITRFATHLVERFDPQASVGADDGRLATLVAAALRRTRAGVNTLDALARHPADHRAAATAVSLLAAAMTADRGLADEVARLVDSPTEQTARMRRESADVSPSRRVAPPAAEPTAPAPRRRIRWALLFAGVVTVVVAVVLAALVAEVG
jgi:hypothetical protein